MKYKILIAFTLLVFDLCSNLSYSQNCSSKVDTLYVISFDIAKKEAPTDLGVLMIEDLNNLIVDKTNYESFVCSIYSNTKYLIPPPLDFESNLTKCYGDSSEYVYNIDAPMFFYGLKKMEKKVYSKEFFLDDDTRVKLKIIKLHAEFWEFLSANRNINNISNQVVIPETCYTHSYIYSIKEFLGIKKLKRNEKHIIKGI